MTDIVDKARRLAAAKSGAPVSAESGSGPGAHYIKLLTGLVDHISSRANYAHESGLLSTQVHNRIFSTLSGAQNHLAEADYHHSMKHYGAATEAIKPAAEKIQQAASQILDNVDSDSPIAQDFNINEASMGLADRHHDAYAAAVTKEINNGR
ncbi:hypothetical protein UFOVP223_15 [uncultured Caudovirales phage]|uniref:Uncharacterized protein n=1 Tax=uncultured Caudovirales phage TaxID=2100421 RepID=A0A6J5L093_9CAUD|nr:hypothetical protein UFOVP110_15 [uncultured Caudovirales phage]CAB5218978.1 hypothetical protein UFOVP223_15 [uncultured Caudovirales phage]